MKRQFVTSVYIVHDNQVLLLHHKKFNKWLAPGGHLDPNELPHLAALREVKEETGLEVSIINASAVNFDYPNASTLPRPYLLLQENIPASAKEEAHEHIDFIYLAQYEGGSLQLNERESHHIKWFGIDELQALDKEDLFPDTLQVAKHLLSPVLSI